MQKRDREGVIHYTHTAVQAAILNPKKSQVIPLFAEETSNEDGRSKQDCELNAAKQLLRKLRQDHRQLSIMICADGLYSNQPTIELLAELSMHYLLVVKPRNHQYLFKWLDFYPSLHQHEHLDEKQRR